MALRKEYPEDFERLYDAWPKFPVGRTKKYESFTKFNVCKKEFGFNADDIAALLKLIERMKLVRVSWQKGSRFGPKAMQSWFEKRLFLSELPPPGRLDGDYETIRDVKQDRWEKANYAEFTETPAEAAAKIAAAQRERENIIQRPRLH